MYKKPRTGKEGDTRQSRNGGESKANPQTKQNQWEKGIQHK